MRYAKLILLPKDRVIQPSIPFTDTIPRDFFLFRNATPRKSSSNNSSNPQSYQALKHTAPSRGTAEAATQDVAAGGGEAENAGTLAVFFTIPVNIREREIG